MLFWDNNCTHVLWILLYSLPTAGSFHYSTIGNQKGPRPTKTFHHYHVLNHYDDTNKNPKRTFFGRFPPFHHPSLRFADDAASKGIPVATITSIPFLLQKTFWINLPTCAPFFPNSYFNHHVLDRDHPILTFLRNLLWQSLSIEAPWSRPMNHRSMILLRTSGCPTIIDSRFAPARSKPFSTHLDASCVNNDEKV